MEKSGVKVVDLGAAHRQKAHDIYWTAITAQSPVHAPALRKLLQKQ